MSVELVILVTLYLKLCSFKRLKGLILESWFISLDQILFSLKLLALTLLLTLSLLNLHFLLLRSLLILLYSMILSLLPLKEVSTKVSLILITFVLILTLSLFVPFSTIRRATVSLNIVMSIITLHLMLISVLNLFLILNLFTINTVTRNSLSLILVTRFILFLF